MTTYTMEELAANHAFLVMTEYDAGVVACISSDFICVAIFNGDGWELVDDEISGYPMPYRHGLGRDGLYGADAARLYDAARDLLWQTTHADREEEEREAIRTERSRR